MIDSRTQFDPQRARSLIKQLVPCFITMPELAARMGVDRRTLERYVNGSREPTYIVQVALEGIYKYENMLRNRRPRPKAFLKNPDYLRDLLKLPARQMQAKWGASQQAVNKHQNMKADEIRRRLERVGA